MRTWLALILALWATPSVAQDLPALYDVTGVAADDVLNIRAAPNAAAPILDSLPPDARGVEVIAVTDGWARINAGEGVGHVALRFLTPQPGPAWHALERPLSCFGTEPFWSLDIDPTTGRAVFRTPDIAGQAYSIGLGYPGSQQFPVAALPLSGGRMALLAARVCSDGMSDRAFGIGIALHPPGSETPILTGCCSLVAP